MIKHFVLFMALAFSCLSYAQNDISPKFQISPLTEVMLKKYYSEEQIKEISNNEEKLILLDYEFSKSFEVLDNSLGSDFNKIDVLNMKYSRKMDEDVVLFDKESNLTIILYSFNKMDEACKKLVPSYVTRKERDINIFNKQNK